MAHVAEKVAVLHESLDVALVLRVADVAGVRFDDQDTEFMKRPFVDRRAQLFEYAMSPVEKALYDDITDYLLEPAIAAFRGSQRRLLLIGFHRRMASSVRALTQSLEKVAERLRRMLGGVDLALIDEAAAFTADLEDDELAGDPSGGQRRRTRRRPCDNAGTGSQGFGQATCSSHRRQATEGDPAGRVRATQRVHLGGH